MRTKNMSPSIESQKLVTDLLCDGSSTELTKAMATLSVSTAGTNTDSAAYKPFNFPPESTSDASTTPFGSSGGVTDSPLFGACSTPVTPPSGSSPLFAVTSNLASGASTSSALFGAAGTPESGVKSSPLFGVPSTSSSCAQSSLFSAPQTSAFGASSSPLFGRPNTTAPGSSRSPLFGASSTSGPPSSPLFGASSTPASGPFSAPLFGQSSTPASTFPGFALVSASSSPMFGSSNKPAFGTSTSPSFGTTFSIPNALEYDYGPYHNPVHVHTKPNCTSSTCSFGASGNRGCWSFGTPTCGVSNPPFSTSTTFQLPASSKPGFSASGPPFGTFHTPPFGAFSRTTSTGGFGSTSTLEFGLCNSSFSPFQGFKGPYFGMSCSSFAGRHGSHLPSGFTSWSSFWKDPVRLSSICVMLACNNIHMSHEELRWPEYRRRIKRGEPNKSAHVNGIGNTDSDLITIKIKIPSQVATQLLDVLMSLHINADSSSTSH